MTNDWQENLEFEREKFNAEHDLRRTELDLRIQEASRTKWNSPLVLAVAGATLALLSSSFVSYIGGRQQSLLEEQRAEVQIALEQKKAESDRILEIIRSPDPQAVVTNLRFLLQSGLIQSPEIREPLQQYLKEIAIKDAPRSSSRYIDSNGCLRNLDGSSVQGFRPGCDEEL